MDEEIVLGSKVGGIIVVMVMVMVMSFMAAVCAVFVWHSKR